MIRLGYSWLRVPRVCLAHSGQRILISASNTGFLPRAVRIGLTRGISGVRTRIGEREVTTPRWVQNHEYLELEVRVIET